MKLEPIIKRMSQENPKPLSRPEQIAASRRALNDFFEVQEMTSTGLKTALRDREAFIQGYAAAPLDKAKDTPNPNIPTDLGAAPGNETPDEQKPTDLAAQQGETSINQK